MQLNFKQILTSIFAVMFVASGFAQNPKATIISPVNNSKYIGGQIIDLSATGIDIKEGNLPDDSFNWFVYLYHGTNASLHVHDGIASRYGVKSWKFEIPVADDHILNADIHYRFALVVINSKGESDTSYSDIYPTIVKVKINSIPKGLSASVFGIGGLLKLPLETNTTVNNQFQLNIPRTQTLGDSTYTFVKWVSGSFSANPVFSVPSRDTSLTAIFTSIITAINDPTDNFGIKIFPNPTLNFLSLSNLKAEFPKQFIIRNVVGEVVKTIPNKYFNTTMEISVEDLKSGMYILELKSENNNLFYQFIRE